MGFFCTFPYLHVNIFYYLLLYDVSLFSCNRISRQGDAISLDSVAPVS
nr:MAG TPA: hypothetical protein [Microviridae sp.]